MHPGMLMTGVITVHNTCPHWAGTIHDILCSMCRKIFYHLLYSKDLSLCEFQVFNLSRKHWMLADFGQMKMSRPWWSSSSSSNPESCLQSETIGKCVSRMPVCLWGLFLTASTLVPRIPKYIEFQVHTTAAAAASTLREICDSANWIVKVLVGFCSDSNKHEVT